MRGTSLSSLQHIWRAWHYFDQRQWHPAARIGHGCPLQVLTESDSGDTTDPPYPPAHRRGAAPRRRTHWRPPMCPAAILIDKIIQLITPMCMRAAFRRLDSEAMWRGRWPNAPPGAGSISEGELGVGPVCSVSAESRTRRIRRGRRRRQESRRPPGHCDVTCRQHDVTCSHRDGSSSGLLRSLGICTVALVVNLPFQCNNSISREQTHKLWTPDTS